MAVPAPFLNGEVLAMSYPSYWIDGKYIYSSNCCTRFWINNSHIYGPNGYSRCWIGGRLISGEKGNLP